MRFQAGLVWEQGAVVFGPALTANNPGDRVTEAFEVVWGDEPMAIDRVLAYLGVVRGERDEFDTVGLGRRRFTGDWLPD